MRTEKKLLSKEALRTIKGGWGFSFGGASSPVSEEPTSPGITESAESGEEVDIETGGASHAPPVLGGMGKWSAF